MPSLAPMLAVTTNTLRETVRDRVLYAFVFFALIMTLVGVLLGSLSVYQDDRILQDIGLFTISTIGGIIAIFVGTNLVYKEVDRRTIYIIFSKPISRWQFICGKFLGLSLCILIVTALMGVFLIATILLTSHTAGVAATIPLLAISLSIIYLELLLVIALAIFFSTFATPLMSVLFTLSIWLASHLSQSLRALANLAGADNPNAKVFFEGLSYVLPDLGRLTQIRSDYMYWPHKMPSDLFSYLIPYVLAYVVILLSVGTLITENREIQ